jgi:hypothetical protein
LQNSKERQLVHAVKAISNPYLQYQCMWLPTWPCLLCYVLAALLVAADSHVRELFHRHCYTNFTEGRPICVSDEHYMASLMASYGLENATDCKVGEYAMLGVAAGCAACACG